MTHTDALPAPVIDKFMTAYLMTRTSATVVQHLLTGRVYVHDDPEDDPFEYDVLNVLLTHDDVMQYAKENRTPARITRAVNAEMLRLHATGQFPSLDDIEATIAEMDDMATVVIPFPYPHTEVI